MLCLITQARAETATLEALYLPLQEATDIVKGQISRQGTGIQAKIEILPDLGSTDNTLLAYHTTVADRSLQLRLTVTQADY